MDLSKNDFDFQRSLNKCKGLMHQNLSFNMLISSNSLFFEQVLPEWSVLTHLDLTACLIQDDVVGYIAAVLPACQALTHLNLSGNLITETGASNIAVVLSRCPTLTDLNLSNYYVRDDVAKVLEDMLNTGYKQEMTVDLRNNPISEATRQRFLDFHLLKCSPLSPFYFLFTNPTLSTVDRFKVIPSLATGRVTPRSVSTVSVFPPSLSAGGGSALTVFPGPRLLAHR